MIKFIRQPVHTVEHDANLGAADTAASAPWTKPDDSRPRNRELV
jgi:hypothetical protein